MPRATAVWLIDNTMLSFRQIAEFCALHLLEVQGIADGEVAAGIRGEDPINNRQLTRGEIARCEANPEERLINCLTTYTTHQQRKAGRYTPISKRQDKPDAVAYLLRNFPIFTDAQVGRLIGTTKQTIKSIRDRSHWKMPSIRPRHPVLLGLCTQSDFDIALDKARADNPTVEIAPADPTGADGTRGKDGRWRQRGRSAAGDRNGEVRSGSAVGCTKISDRSRI